MSMSSSSTSDGQRGNNVVSLVSRVGRFHAEHKPMTRQERLDSAYEFLERQVNTLSVQRMVGEEQVFDSASTYELRLAKVRGSYMTHHLPENASIRVNDRTAQAELYVGNRKYKPRAQ